MACPYCHDPGHSSLGKCRRWTGRLGAFGHRYGRPTSRYAERGLAAMHLPALQELEQMLAAYKACPDCVGVHDGVAPCDKHARTAP